MRIAPAGKHKGKMTYSAREMECDDDLKDMDADETREVLAEL